MFNSSSENQPTYSTLKQYYKYYLSWLDTSTRTLRQKEIETPIEFFVKYMLIILLQTILKPKYLLGLLLYLPYYFVISSIIGSSEILIIILVLWPASIGSSIINQFGFYPIYLLDLFLLYTITLCSILLFFQVIKYQDSLIQSWTRDEQIILRIMLPTLQVISISTLVQLVLPTIHSLSISSIVDIVFVVIAGFTLLVPPVFLLLTDHYGLTLYYTRMYLVLLIGLVIEIGYRSFRHLPKLTIPKLSSVFIQRFLSSIYHFLHFGNRLIKMKVMRYQ